MPESSAYHSWAVMDDDGVIFQDGGALAEEAATGEFLAIAEGGEFVGDLMLVEIHGVTKSRED